MKAWKRFKRGFYRIHIVDRCLMVIMAIFLLQSAYSLIVNEHMQQNNSPLDSAFRTSSAAIFGYFISANFIRNRTHSGRAIPTVPPSSTSPTNALAPPPPVGFVQPPSPPAPVQAPTALSGEPTSALSTIGFVAEDSTPASLQASPAPTVAPPEPIPDMRPPERTESNEMQLQIVITTAVGVFSLVVLIIYRNHFEMSPYAAGTVTQFRDFLSGCVGFLIGCATGDDGESPKAA